MSIGAMRERIELLDPTPPALGVVTLTRSGAIATAQTAAPHGFVNGDYVTMVGAVPSGYNGQVKITVVDNQTFTFPVSSSLATPASGTITGTYVMDAQGGRKLRLRVLTTFFAELIPLRAGEGRQLEGVAAQLDLRFRSWVRNDLRENMQVRWTPRFPPRAEARVLQIHGLLPDGDGTKFVFIDVGEAR